MKQMQAIARSRRLVQWALRRQDAPCDVRSYFRSVCATGANPRYHPDSYSALLMKSSLTNPAQSSGNTTDNV